MNRVDGKSVLGHRRNQRNWARSRTGICRRRRKGDRYRPRCARIERGPGGNRRPWSDGPQRRRSRPLAPMPHDCAIGVEPHRLHMTAAHLLAP
jgi:hypothetical protein